MLELELRQALHQIYDNERHEQALAIRLGWDGSGGTTLAAAGSATGYTRERVRQLEARLGPSLAGMDAALPLTMRALDLIEALVPARRHELGLRLCAAGLAEQPFDPVGVLRAAELAGVRVEVVERNGILVRRGDASRLEGARRIAARLAGQSGAVHLRAVAAQVGEPADQTRAVLEVDPAVRWLDADREWLALPGRPSRARRAVEKMLEAAGELHLADVDDGLRTLAPPLLLPRRVLRAWCEAQPWLGLDPDLDVVWSLRPGRFLSRTERELVALLLDAGRPLRLTEIGRLAPAVGVNSTTAMVYAWRSPAIRCTARGLYVVRGRAVESRRAAA
ncbi:MAG TPA: hypothetical protein VHD91_08110 [Gaiellaceae bacterium]|nr:hypothetical protein [Gaiellaceae bacterium]